MNNKSVLTAVIVTAIIIVGFLIYAKKADSGPGKYDEFAVCLKDKGAIFYGAFWCSHCQNQKAMFGKSATLLPYVECSTPNGSGQLALCAEKGIQSYPTWVFADGATSTGEVPLPKLAEKTGCVLPE